MKIVRIDGGLGNQMFCYAFAVALREESREDVLIDSHRYVFFPNHNGYELDSLFKITCKEALKKDLWKVTIPASNEFQSRIISYLPHRRTEICECFEKYYPSIISEHRDGYYIGNWQNWRYFDKYQKKVLEELSWKHALDDRNETLYKQLYNECDSISIHIRRGDYLSDSKYCGICELDYYETAISEARKYTSNPHFVIFSNDLEWCKTHIAPLVSFGEVTYVDWNTGIDSHKDMRLMSACRINIIANSSFSWWAAYMNQRNDKLVISPDKWINLPLEYRIQMPDWRCI